MSQEELYRPTNEGDAVRALVSELKLDVSDEQMRKFTVQELLGLASGDLRINRNPTAPYGHITEWVGDANLPVNGHDYI